MDQNALLAMLMQGQAPKQLMMNPAPALAGLPGGGDISAPMLPQQAPPPAIMAPPAHRPQTGMQHPMMGASPPPPDPGQSQSPVAAGIGGLANMLGGDGGGNIMQMLAGMGGQQKGGTDTLSQIMQAYGFLRNLGGAAGSGF